MVLTVGVLALQGAFVEHMMLLRRAASQYPSHQFAFLQVRTRAEVARCDALVIPGGESTTLSLVAERSGLLEPLREFVKCVPNPVSQPTRVGPYKRSRRYLSGLTASRHGALAPG